MSLDPRTRLVLLLLGVVALAVTTDVRLLAAAASLLLVAVAILGYGNLLPRILRLAVPLSILIFALSYYGSGWQEAIAAVLRLVAMSTAAVLVFGSTPPESLGNALVAGGLPFQAAFVLMAALQFVPLFARRALAIRDAQRARGVRLDRGLASFRNYHVLALPVLYQSFKLADELAEALESRGFSRPGRTFRHTYRLGQLDWLLILGGTVATLLYAWWGRW